MNDIKRLQYVEEDLIKTDCHANTTRMAVERPKAMVQRTDNEEQHILILQHLALTLSVVFRRPQ